MEKKSLGSANMGSNELENALDSLRKSIARWTGIGERQTTAVPGLSLFKRNEPTAPTSAMYEPSICMVMQGAKRVLLGEETYLYDAHHYLISVRGPPHLCADRGGEQGETIPGAQAETGSTGDFTTDD